MIKQTQQKSISLIGMDAHSEHVTLCITNWSHGSDPVVRRTITIPLNCLETTYKKQIPPGSLTVLESSTNSFSIHDRLLAIGYKSKVLVSDTLAGRSRADNINDRSDATKLAVAYARGGTRQVHVPSAYYRRLRDIYFGYRNAVKDSTRCSNRIWAFCSQYGLSLPKRTYRRKVASVKAALMAHNWSEEDQFHIDVLLQAYKDAVERRELYMKRIVEIVHSYTQRIMLMRVVGVRFRVAFVLVAFIEDVSRFENPKKLAAYIGLNPTVCDSGKHESRRKVSSYGRSDLRSLMVEAAQAAYRAGSTKAVKWARYKVLSGKNVNLMICALARKMAVKAWHILMGHPVPDKEDEKSFTLKLRKLACAIGKERLAEFGHKNSKEYADSVCVKLYAQLNDELQTAECMHEVLCATKR